MKICLYFFLLMFNCWALAQVPENELPYLFIPPVAMPADFSEFENQQVNKIVVKGSAKQTFYQVIIGNPKFDKKFKWSLFKINITITKNPDGISVLAELIDVRKDKMINAIQENFIQQLEFYRRLEDIMNRIFIKPEKLTDVEEKPKSKKNKSELSQTVTEAEQANINFRERIMDLKTDVNAAVAKAGVVIKDKLPPESVAGIGKDPNAPKKNPAANALSPNDEGVPFVEAPLLIVPPKGTLPIDLGHSVRVGWYNVNTNSKDNIIDTDSHPKYLLVDYEYARGWSHNSKFYHHANIRYGKAMNKEEKEFAPYMGWALMEGYFVQSFKWMPKIGLELDTISFVNLPRVGQGLKVANNKILWLDLASVNNFEFFGLPFRLSFIYSKPLKIFSGYNGLDENPSLSGSKINLTLAALNVWRKFHIEINYFKSTMVATSDRVIEFDTQGAGLNAYYNF